MRLTIAGLLLANSESPVVPSAIRETMLTKVAADKQMLAAKVVCSDAM